MPSAKVIFSTFYLLAFCGSATAQSFLEKEQHGVDLTDIELVNIFLAEIKDCELKVPEFKSQSKPDLDKFTNSPKFKKVAEKKGFDDPELKAEAMKFISYKRKNRYIRNECETTLKSLKFQATRAYEK